jgi:hypothetical protein
MNNRKFIIVIAWALICAFTCGVIVGHKYGREMGRAEQAKIDAAKPPVVKEVPPKFTFDGAGIKSECIPIDAGKLYCNFTEGVGFVGAPAPKCIEGIGCKYLNMAPKPSKGSKPRSNIKWWEGGPAGGTITLPAEPAPPPTAGDCLKVTPTGTVEKIDCAKPQPAPKMCEMSEPGATLYWPARADGTCHRADWGDGSWKPKLGQPEPWDCGDGKLTTAPCPASAKPQPEVPQ